LLAVLLCGSSLRRTWCLLHSMIVSSVSQSDRECQSGQSFCYGPCIARDLLGRGDAALRPSFESPWSCSRANQPLSYLTTDPVYLQFGA
jgi:hypothetical protein